MSGAAAKGRAIAPNWLSTTEDREASETINARVAPGEGEFPLAEFIAVLGVAGYDGLYGVELLSDAWRTMPVEKAARRSGGAALTLLEGNDLF